MNRNIILKAVVLLLAAFTLPTLVPRTQIVGDAKLRDNGWLSAGPRYIVFFEDLLLSRGESTHNYKLENIPDAAYKLYFQAYLDCSSKDYSDFSVREKQRIVNQEIGKSEVALGVSIFEDGLEIYSTEKDLLNHSYPIDEGPFGSSNSSGKWRYNLYAHKPSAIRYEDIESMIVRDKRVNISRNSTYQIEVFSEAREDISDQVCLQLVIEGGSSLPL